MKTIEGARVIVIDRINWDIYGFGVAGEIHPSRLYNFREVHHFQPLDDPDHTFSMPWEDRLIVLDTPFNRERIVKYHEKFNEWRNSQPERGQLFEGLHQRPDVGDA